MDHLSQAALGLADLPLDGAGACFAGTLGLSWSQYLGALRSLQVQTLDELVRLEEVAFKSARRAQNRAASASLRDFQ
eukprot:1272344-Pyramimonas_sp.AAC.1